MVSSTLNVLVVDQIFHVRKLIRWQLTELGHESDEATTANEALTFITGGGYNLLVVGQLSGKNNSRWLISYIRSSENRKRPLPILVLTDSIHTSEFTRTMGAGADGFVLFNQPEEFLAAAIEKATRPKTDAVVT